MITPFFITDTLKNVLCRTPLVYVVESRDWSIWWDGYYITTNLAGRLAGRVSRSALGLRRQIVHFGSINTLIGPRGIRRIHPSNKAILTWFHITPTDPRLRYISELNERVNIVHTSCEQTRQGLIDRGLIPDHIRMIPLGVDTRRFHPYDLEKRSEIRQRLGIAPETMVAGSFQKDGVGWGEGNEPKWVKGPDVFCDVVASVAKERPLHVLLTGPARGYVKRRLRAAGVPFTHAYLKNYWDIVDYYNALDCYLITARAEGGPKALLESLACGVPVVTTRVGMAPELIRDGENGWLVAIDGREELIKKMGQAREGSRATLIKESAIRTAAAFAWSKIAARYYEELYQPLLD